MLARHHRPDPPPALVFGARPQPALIDQRQQAGVHQRGFAGARVAVDLQPAHGREAQASVEAGERVQRFLLPAEEQLRLIRTIGGEPDERATLERDGVVGDDVALADVAEQAFGQLIGAVPGRDLEQPQERRNVSGSLPSSWI